jgi:hypothetical protein
MSISHTIKRTWNKIYRHRRGPVCSRRIGTKAATRLSSPAKQASVFRSRLRCVGMPEMAGEVLETRKPVNRCKPRVVYQADLPDCRFDALSTCCCSMSWRSSRPSSRTSHATGFTDSAAVSGDKLVTVSYFWTLAMQSGQIWIGTGLLPAAQKAARQPTSIGPLVLPALTQSRRQALRSKRLRATAI